MGERGVEIIFMNLDEAILKTVSYFDLFDHPLSRGEIWKYLIGAPASFREVDAATTALLGKKLEEKNGLIFFPGRGSIVSVRGSRYRHSCRKWRRAGRWARFFAAIPGVELVGVGNTLSYNNAKDGSDIDFFIVGKPGTLWRTRAFCSVLPALFKLRPRPESGRDKLCLSFFATSAGLDLAKLSRSGEDVYLEYWIRLMTPLAGKEEAARLFAAVNRVEPRGKTGVPRFWKILLSPIGILPGTFLKKIQIALFPRELAEAAARRDGSVVVSDEILKFHVNDRRAEISERWTKKYLEVILN